MKIIAWHLPQFHEIKENNEWWGKGFTEWTNVKKCKSMFREHYQPREPLNDNYYNLLEKQTMEWQCDLSKKYGIDGFCYYHYWFDGKLLLEKPIENLLKWKDIDQKFCLSWANEPWTRAWDGGEKQILMQQSYGGEKEWDEHLKYLLPFFKDKRYIKKDGMPMFLLYRTENIENCDKMIDYWNNEMIKLGLKKIYFVETFNSFQNEKKIKNTDMSVYMEPMITIKEKLKNRNIVIKILKKLKRIFFNIPLIENYDQIWEMILNRNLKINKENKSFLSGFIEWDNTSRKGKKGLIIKGGTPKKFQKNMEKQIEKSKKISNDFLFINAWNEWAEGTYLEPCKKNGYKYLESLKRARKNQGI